MSRASNSLHSARRPGRKSGSGSVTPMFIMIGSRMRQAISFRCSSNRARTPFRSLKEATSVWAYDSGGIPSLQLTRSEEHTSELQSQSNLVCRLLLEKKKAADRARQQV